MANMTYYKAIDSIADGTKGTQITSGQIDGILPYLTSQMRIAGVTQTEKFYIESDVNLEVFIGFKTLGIFVGSLMDSTGLTEVAGDINASEPRYGASEILANSADGCTIKHNENLDLFRPNDYILVGDIVAQIDTITENTTDRVILYKLPIPYVDLIGTNACSVLPKSLVAGEATPLWVENVVVAGSPATQTYNTLPLAIVS